jgi:hypothetical protein
MTSGVGANGKPKVAVALEDVTRLEAAWRLSTRRRRYFEARHPFYFVAQVPTIGHCATRTFSFSRVDLMPAMTVAISSAVAT